MCAYEDWLSVKVTHPLLPLPHSAVMGRPHQEPPRRSPQQPWPRPCVSTMTPVGSCTSLSSAIHCCDMMLSTQHNTMFGVIHSPFQTMLIFYALDCHMYGFTFCGISNNIFVFTIQCTFHFSLSVLVTDFRTEYILIK